MQSIGLFSTFIGLLVMYWLVYVFDPELHRTYVQYEDRLVEWLTFFFFMLASCTFKAAIMRSMRRCSIMRGAMGIMADSLE